MHCKQICNFNSCLSHFIVLFISGLKTSICGSVVHNTFEVFIWTYITIKKGLLKALWYIKDVHHDLHHAWRKVRHHNFHRCTHDVFHQGGKQAEQPASQPGQPASQAEPAVGFSVRKRSCLWAHVRSFVWPNRSDLWKKKRKASTKRLKNKK